MEYILGCFDFLGIHMPNEKKADKKYNETEADEFYTAESKMLAYLTIMGQIKKVRFFRGNTFEGFRTPRLFSSWIGSQPMATRLSMNCYPFSSIVLLS